MITVISLEDEEDDCTIQVVVDETCSGVLIYCTDTFDQRMQLIVDASLLKQLCTKVSKAVKTKAQKNNKCGYVKEDVLLS